MLLMKQAVSLKIKNIAHSLSMLLLLNLVIYQKRDFKIEKDTDNF